MVGGDRRSPPRSGGGGGDGSSAGGEFDRRRSGGGSGGNRRGGDRSPSKANLGKTRGKALVMSKGGIEDAISKDRKGKMMIGLNSAVDVLIDRPGEDKFGNSGSQAAMELTKGCQSSAIKQGDGILDESFKNSNSRMMDNPTFASVDSIMEDESIMADMINRDGPLQELPIVHNGDTRMENCIEQGQVGNAVQINSGFDKSAMNSGYDCNVAPIVGVNWGEASEGDQAKLQDGISCARQFATKENSTNIFGKVKVQGVEKGRDPASNSNNVWKKPEHIRILQAEEISDISSDGITVNLHLESVNQNMLMLERAVVGKIMGKRLPFFLLKSEIHRQWNRFGEFQLTTIGQDCFACIFSSNEARDAVLCGGPWFIGGGIVGLDKWTPHFSPDSMVGLSSPVWIRLPYLPLQYWDLRNISRIASMIGTPLWIDAQTGSWGRREFARVCVRLELDKKLQPGIWINGLEGKFYQKVEYEGISLLCYSCGKLGHRKETCPARGGAAVNIHEGQFQHQGKQPKDTNIERSLPSSSAKNVNDNTSKASTSGVKSEGGSTKGKAECNQPQSVNEVQEADELGPWIQVPPRRRRANRPQQQNSNVFRSKDLPVLPK